MYYAFWRRRPRVLQWLYVCMAAGCCCSALITSPFVVNQVAKFVVYFNQSIVLFVKFELIKVYCFRPIKSSKTWLYLVSPSSILNQNVGITIIYCIIEI